MGSISASGVDLRHLDDSGLNVDTYGYDTFGRVKHHRWLTSADTMLCGWAYDYDRLGDKKYQEDLDSALFSELYAYDDAYRLTSFERGELDQDKDEIASPTRAQTWTLSDLGNWASTVLDSVTETRTHNDVNELTARTVDSLPEVTLTYDDAGNLTQDGDSNGDHKYAWDYRNRLIEVQEKQSGNWNTIAEYKYDAQNRRIRKEVTNKGALNGTTRYIWGGNGDWQCLEERNGDGDLVARYTYAPDYIDAVAVQERDLNDDDDFDDEDEVTYYLSNTLYNVYGLSDADEDVVERYQYDAYGGSTVLDPDRTTDADNLSDVGNPYHFTGRRLDPESGLMQYRNRMYAPLQGRFINRDPVGYAGPFNLYSYANSEPIGTRDPHGLTADGEEKSHVDCTGCNETQTKELEEARNKSCECLGWVAAMKGEELQGIADIWKKDPKCKLLLTADHTAIRQEVLDIVEGARKIHCGENRTKFTCDASPCKKEKPNVKGYCIRRIADTSKGEDQGLVPCEGPIHVCPEWWPGKYWGTIMHEMTHYGGLTNDERGGYNDAHILEGCFVTYCNAKRINKQ